MRLSIFALLASFVSARHFEIDRFETWIKKFNIAINDGSHYIEVYKKWLDNDKYIAISNAKNLSFVLDHNQFSGMNSTEFSKYLMTSATSTNYLRKTVGESVLLSSVQSLPVSVNWVDKGAVTPVKDQGQCGSCWSFSTTGALEGAFAIKNGVLRSFSEQQLVDCDNLKNGGKDHGCNGGLMDNAFSWINKNGGLCSEDSYPYVSGVTKTAGSCMTSCVNVQNSKISKHVDVSPSSDSAMMTALSMQPVSVAIEADQKEFQLYKSGVFTGSCGTNLDHGVLVVGYGTENGEDYYLVKNSWGVSWGESGYIKLGRGPSYNKGNGQCGVLLQASYPML